jgi:hypothetical protein
MEGSHKSHAPTAFPPWERAPGTHWIGRCVGPRVRQYVFEKRNLWPFPGSRNPDRPAQGQVTTPIMLSPLQVAKFYSVVSSNKVNQQTILSFRMWHHGVCQKFTDVLGECASSILDSFLSNYFWTGGTGKKEYSMANDKLTVHLQRCTFYSPMAQQPPVGQGLLNSEASILHWDTSHSVGLIGPTQRPLPDNTRHS